jgi:diguanylate cyclase (GGDEF)-like protein
MKNLGIRYRIVIFCTILVVVVQGITFSVVNTSNLIAAEKASRQDLQVGSKVLRRYMQEIANQHLEAANILASDFGLRTAIATSEPNTIQSLVASHSKRIDADLFMVLLPDKSLLVTSDPAGLDLADGDLSKLIDQAESNGYASGYCMIKDLAYEVTVVPVFAPDLIAWLVLSSRVDSSLARGISELTGLHVSFLTQHNGSLKPLESTLPIEQLVSLTNQFVINLSSDPGLEILVQDDYMNQLIRFEDSSIVSMLHSSLSEARAEMNRLSNLFIILLLTSFGIAIMGSLIIARHITRPLGILAEIASNIQRGEYNQAADIAQQDELGVLAESLNHMRKTITVLLELAYRDVLTNLPNRAMFNSHLLQTLKLSERNRSQFTFLMIDLDEFKLINDTYGHEAGDAVIRETGKRLKQTLRESDLVARIGGDEFAVILMSHEVNDIQAVADKIHLNLAQTIKIGDLNLSTSCSIGAAIFPDHGADTVTLMRRADISMYVSKRSKSTSVTIYNSSYETSS